MGQKVLVIDESQDYREVLTIRLRAAGYKAIEAETGANGLAKAPKGGLHEIRVN